MGVMYVENTERVINRVRSSDKEAMTTVTFRTRKEDYEAYKKRCDELHIGYTEPLREFVRDVVVYGLDEDTKKSP